MLLRKVFTPLCCVVDCWELENRSKMNDSFQTDSRRTASLLKQELFPAKQRGFYSDILREEAAGELQVGAIMVFACGGWNWLKF